MSARINAALDSLVAKYGVPRGKVVEEGGVCKVHAHGGEFHLLPWRVERRFTELKKLISGDTLNDVSTLRFGSISPGGDLFSHVAREIDLATWMIGSPAVSLFAACAAGVTANLIVKLANGVSVSVECSTKLPKGAELMDRHEIIARRGVASDRAVDTQLPQSSLYAFTASGDEQYTDTDAEIFGLPEEDIRMVRAAFAVLENPDLGREWNRAAVLMDELASAAMLSDSTFSVIKLQGNE